jgi:hypothetical protein
MDGKKGKGFPWPLHAPLPFYLSGSRSSRGCLSLAFTPKMFVKANAGSRATPKSVRQAVALRCRQEAVLGKPASSI